MIQIIPREEKKPFPLEKIFLTFSVLIFLSSFFYLGYLFWEENNLKNKIKKAEEKISLLKTEEIKNLENEVVEYEKEISKFAEILKEHFFPTKLFSFLESNTHPKVFFSRAEIDFSNSKIVAVGKADDFISAHQQYQIFKENPNLNVEIKKISLSKDGKVEFELEIIFDKNILK